MGIVLAAVLGLVQPSFEASDLHDRARTLIERGRHEESARILKTLIADYPDRLVKLGDGRLVGSVVAALEVARSLPAPLEERLLSFAESEAKSVLPEAVPDDRSLLERAAAYFPAPTAARALHLLAILEFDSAHLASAARRWKRVRQDPALASAAKSRLRLTRWRPPPAPERIELAPKWEADAAGTRAVFASGTLLVSGAYALCAVCPVTGEVLARSEMTRALCAEGPRVFVQRGSHLECLDAGTLRRKWRRYSPKMASVCCGGGRVFSVARAAGGNHQLACLDVRTGTELWKRSVGRGLLYGAGPRVFLTEEDGGLTAFDASSGGVVWALEGTGKKKALPGRHGKAREMQRLSAGMCSGLVIRTGEELRPAAFDPLDGTEVWTSPEEGALYAGEVCGLCILKGKTVSALDPVSGEIMWKARPRLSRRSNPAGWKGAVVFLSEDGLVAYGAEEGYPLRVVGRHKILGGALLEAEGGIIAVDGKKTTFLCDAREELARLETLPGSPSVSIRIAEILRLLGRPEEAFRRVEGIGAEAVREERARRRFVRTLRAIGEALMQKPALAGHAHKKALGLARTQDEKSSCLLALARAKEAAGDPEKAVALCQRVIEECPGPMLPYDEHLSTRAPIVAQRMIEQFCGEHGWGAYRKIEQKAALSGLDARGLYRRFPNSMAFCRRAAERIEDRSLVAAALSSLRGRKDEELTKLASTLRAALGTGAGPRYTGLEKAWFIETKDSLLRPGGSPGRGSGDPPVLTLDPRQATASAYDRVTGKLLWRKDLQGQLLECRWAGEHLVFLCRETLARTQAKKDSVMAVEAKWGRLAWSGRIPARLRSIRSPVFLSDGEYVVAGNEFGAVVYDGRGRRIREIEGTVVGVEAGVALVFGRMTGALSREVLRAVELRSGAAVFEAHTDGPEAYLFEGSVLLSAGSRWRRIEFPSGRPLLRTDPIDEYVLSMNQVFVVARCLEVLRASGVRMRSALAKLKGMQSWVVSGERLVCVLSGADLRLAGFPLRKGKPWEKGYDSLTSRATLLGAGRDAVVLWYSRRGTAAGKALLLDAAKGKERACVDLAVVPGAPVKCGESVWGQVRGGIVCLELTPAPEDVRRLARKGGDEFFRHVAGLFRKGLSRVELAGLTRLLDAGRRRKKLHLRARKLSVKVDGDLSEWAKASWTEFSGLERLWPDPLKSAPPPPPGPGGLSARAAVGWDEKGMYAAVLVTDDTDAPGDAVEIHLLPYGGTRFRTLGKRLHAHMTVRSRLLGTRRTLYEWGGSWEALGVVEPKKKPGPRFRSVRDFDPQRTRRFALMDLVVRDDDGEGARWSLCLTGEALGPYDGRGFARIEFGE